MYSYAHWRIIQNISIYQACQIFNTDVKSANNGKPIVFGFYNITDYSSLGIGTGIAMNLQSISAAWRIILFSSSLGAIIFIEVKTDGTSKTTKTIS